MNIFCYESGKIWTKKIVLFGLLLMLAWLIFYFYVTSKDYTCVVDGVVYRGMDAARMDREITKQFEGQLTEETAQAIVDQYGFSVYEMNDDKGYYRDGNFCNHWVTDHLTPYTETYDYTADELELYSGDQIDQLKEYTENQLYFAYCEGWRQMMMTLDMVLILINFVIIIAVANVFTEEYALKTAPILLTTRHGKKKDIIMKILAALAFSVALYIIVCGATILSYSVFFGTDGLNASGALIGYMKPDMMGLFGNSIGASVGEILLLGLISVIMSTCITLAVSAICKQPFTSILCGLGMLILPYIYVAYIHPMLPLNIVTAWIERLARWFPIFLPVRILGSVFFSALGFALFICLLAGCLGYRRYKNYQETS